MDKYCSENYDRENMQKKKQDATAQDPEYLSCLLPPCFTDSDRNYIGIRRVLLLRKPKSSLLHRKVLS